MQNGYRWTVRNIDRSCLIFLEEIKETSGNAYGEIVCKAIKFFYHALFEADANITELRDLELMGRDGEPTDEYVCQPDDIEDFQIRVRCLINDLHNEAAIAMSHAETDAASPALGNGEG